MKILRCDRCGVDQKDLVKFYEESIPDRGKADLCERCRVALREVLTKFFTTEKK